MHYLEASSSHCLHISTSFLGLQSYGLGGLSKVSRGVYAPWAPQASYLPQFHYLNYPDYVGHELMNSWAQLLLELSPFDDSFFGLPPLTCAIFNLASLM